MLKKKPKIIAFCCHYCAFTAADLAGTMRLQYPANVNIVRLPCTGKVNANMLLQAFVDEADGVMVAGCEPGSCHFLEGNVRAVKRVSFAREKLSEAGINPERLEMFHIPASEGPLFAKSAKEFTEKISQLEKKGDGEADEPDSDETGVETGETDSREIGAEKGEPD